MRSKTFCKIMNEAGQDVYTSDFNEYYNRVNDWLFTWDKSRVVNAQPINCVGCVHLSKPKDLRRFMTKVLKGGI